MIELFYILILNHIAVKNFLLISLSKAYLLPDMHHCPFRRVIFHMLTSFNTSQPTPQIKELV